MGSGRVGLVEIGVDLSHFTLAIMVTCLVISDHQMYPCLPETGGRQLACLAFSTGGSERKAFSRAECHLLGSEIEVCAE